MRSHFVTGHHNTANSQTCVVRTRVWSGVVALLLATAPIAMLTLAPAVATAEDTESGDLGDESPLWSPEAMRDLGIQPDASESDDASNPRSLAPRASRNTLRIGKVVAKAGDTVRALAYRYFTSPSLLALVNKIPFVRDANPALAPGQTVQVPIAHGSPSGFSEGEQLLPGPGIQSTQNFDRKWGRPGMVRLLRQAFGEVARKWPQRHPALIGSLSKAGGGRLGRHKSHRSGQDIDVGYYTSAAKRDEWGRPGLAEIDFERTWHLVDWLERSGHVAAIFMAPDIQRKLYAYASQHGVSEERLRTLLQYGPKGGRGDTLIRNSPGHRDHMHIRLWVPEDMGDIRADLGV